MSKRYRPYCPEQMLLLPPSLQDWLPKDHLAYFVRDVVSQMDLSEIEAYYESDERGQPPYHPRMMTTLLIYGYCIGVSSSRQIQKGIQEDVAFRVLAAGNEPDFRTLSDFRKIHRKALEKLFEKGLRLALESGAVRLGRVALDGSKMKANASKHKAMSYGRMDERLKQLRAQAKALLDQADAVDAQEDARYGKDRRGDELPEELRHRESRIQRIKEAKKALEERAREEAEAAGKPKEEAKPDNKAQYNFTDPESRIMKGPDGFVQAYNVQLAVEDSLQLIVGQAVTAEANDKQQLETMVEVVKAQSGQQPEQVLADSGYCSDKNLKYLEEQKIDAYIATDKQKHDTGFGMCPKGRVPKKATRVERMRRKLQTKTGSTVYAARKCVVEPVFGQIKQARGFRQFLLRGMEKVRMEWALVCLGHNILKMYGAVHG